MTSEVSRVARRGLSANLVRALSATAIALALSGCYTPATTTGSIPNDYRKRHPIALKEGERTVEIFIGKSRGGLTPPQRADVLAFAHAWKRESTGGVIIDVPMGTGNDVAAAGVTHEIGAILTAAGVPPQSVNVRTYSPASAGKLATVKLNYSKIVAEAGPCGLWPHDLGPAADPAYVENRPFWNLGCSTQRNLAAMVENPADLVQPRGDAPAYAPRRTTVVDKYRKGEDSSTTYKRPDDGKLSDVGK
jgi:pilus assembly protein CpaD